MDGRELEPVGPGDGGVDLKRQPGRFTGGDAAQGPLISPVHGPEAVVGGGGGPVDGDGQALNTGVLEACGHGRGQQRAVNRHDHAVAQIVAVSRQVEDVGPKQGLAAGQDHHYLPHGRQVVQELFPLCGGQFAGIRARPRRGPAMETGQVAAPGGLPGQEAERGDFLRLSWR